MSNKRKDIRGSILFTVAFKRIKYLGINIPFKEYTEFIQAFKKLRHRLKQDSFFFFFFFENVSCLYFP